MSNLEEQPLSVSAYLAQVNSVLKTQTGRVKGEVTEVSESSAAMYFTLRDKEQNALLKSMIWKNDYRLSGVELKDGIELIITGFPDIYPSFGLFKFKATTLEYAGEGQLKKAYEKLKADLEMQGLLAPERKRPLPDFPKKIGVITSKNGVVHQDFMVNLRQRGYKITLVDSRVEGKDAIHDLMAALKTMAKQDIEVLAIMRGGGSWESLQAFNTEQIVREVASFKVPVITGIGHDVDETLVQLVADIGRSTPTAVAEALNKPWEGLLARVDSLERRTVGNFSALLVNSQRQILFTATDISRGFERRLAAYRSQMHNHSTRVVGWFNQLARRIGEASATLQKLSGIMKSSLALKHRDIRLLGNRVDQQFKQQVSGFEQRLRSASSRINSNNPERNLKLGYSLSFVNGKLVRKVADIKLGQNLTTRLTDGEFTSEVKGVK
jgi:exodeoxyribonuclease VII large subunit